MIIVIVYYDQPLTMTVIATEFFKDFVKTAKFDHEEIHPASPHILIT